MTDLKFTYNPYLVVTIIEQLRDGKFMKLGKGNSVEKNCKDRLQTWDAYALFQSLVYDELDDDKVSITFVGRETDYIDFEELVTHFNESQDSIKVNLNKPELSSKESKIKELKELFDFIKKGPIKDLTDDCLEDKYNKAINSEFEIAVIAPMSSGKSTLINALLGRKLMPAINAATTAKLVKIKDVDEMKEFQGITYNNMGEEIATYKSLNYDLMKQINDNKDVFMCSIEGDIPGVSSQEMKLVITDTPGPNNSQDDGHKTHTYRVINSSYKPIVLFVLNVAQQETNDEEFLLREISNAMKVGGKQSKDRFIFVVNKVDILDPQEEPVEKLLEKMKIYLEKFGIENPNLYLASARLAMLLRMSKNGIRLNPKENIDMNRFKSFNEEKDFHLEKFASLSSLQMKKIEKKIQDARESNKEIEEAIYHTGIPSIELAINEYLTKYAVPLKIKEAVDTFKRIIDDKNLENVIRDKVSVNNASRERLKSSISRLEEVLETGKLAQDISEEIKAMSYIPSSDVYALRKVLDTTIREAYENLDSTKISKIEADKLINNINEQLKNVPPKVKAMMKNILEHEIISKAKDVCDSYTKHVQGVLNFENVETSDIDIDKYLTSNLVDSASVADYVYNEKVVVGTRRKKLFGFIPWFGEVNVYGNRDFVDGKKFLTENIEPLRSKYTKEITMFEDEIKSTVNNMKSIILANVNDLNKVLIEKNEILRKILIEVNSGDELSEEIANQRQFLIDVNNKMNVVMGIRGYNAEY